MSYLRPRVPTLRNGRLQHPGYGFSRNRSRPFARTRRFGEEEGLSGIMDFPTVQSAINYVKAKVGAFFQLPYEYAQAKKKIPVMLEVAKRKGDNTTVAKLTALDAGVNSLQAGYPATESKVNTLLDGLKAAGLGFLPLLVAGAAVVVGGAVAYQLVTWGKLKTELDAIEKGTVGAGFFDQKLFGFSFSGLLPILAIGGVGLFFFMRKKK